MASDRGRELAQQAHAAFASEGLPPAIAKLYSQYSRLRTDRPGLAGWRADEFGRRLDDAVLLVHASLALIDKETGGWEAGLVRAAEILEWLNAPELNTGDLPLPVLSAAAYQLAGYPARASGVLAEARVGEPSILTSFLSLDFDGVLEASAQYWSANLGDERADAGDAAADLFALTESHVVSCLAAIAAGMRWADFDRTSLAVEHLRGLASWIARTDDPYWWLVAVLSARSADTFVQASLRSAVAPLRGSVSADGRVALERYVRRAYQAGRSLAWPSQLRGIRQLETAESFALFTPTGSGKTAVAELAILQGLFPANGEDGAPLALYLTPSRALAAEVEAKLSAVLRRLSARSITVTGLYGGIDWGPTDAWLTADEPTVLICTYEKAEALIRFLGPTFLGRLTLVVVDEAHSVATRDSTASLRAGTSRALRLESLSARLFAYLGSRDVRIVAISAVAGGVERAVAGWANGGDPSTSARSAYRSTRQLIGRLECRRGGDSNIEYDVLDGHPLTFESEGDGDRDRPFVPSPFGRFPAGPDWDERPEKGPRPYTLWAAIQLARSGGDIRRGVLVSVSQKIGDCASDFAELLEDHWDPHSVPEFFREPSDPSQRALWSSCLAACEDYFGQESPEYRLLQRGIAVHHGRMPGLLARLLVNAIAQRIVSIVVATSTLTEGVNLPFEYILIPSLTRWDPDIERQRRFTGAEFRNLIGRAGRPGLATEGQSLVVIPPLTNRAPQARATYRAVVTEAFGSEEVEAVEVAPLARLIRTIRADWQRVFPEGTDEDFSQWLEQTAPTEVGSVETGGLDSLDAVLLAALVEFEGGREIDATELERRLIDVWRRSFTAAALEKAGEDFEAVFVSRGLTLHSQIYPNRSRRRELYRTSLRPTEASALLERYPEIVDHLRQGDGYARWTSEDRLTFINETIAAVRTLPPFEFPEASGSVPWTSVLRWWLTREPAGDHPRPREVARWHGFISDSFGYRFNWALGSILGAATAHSLDQPTELSAETWGELELPWVVFWLKELLIWGTLDPVAACLLSRRVAATRPEAEEMALSYYAELEESGVEGDPLDARLVHRWLQGLRAGDGSAAQATQDGPISATLVRDFAGQERRRWRVIPVDAAGQVVWTDPAGFPLATSETSALSSVLEPIRRRDFELDVAEQLVHLRAVP